MACTFSACKHRVSGSLSLPSRGSFHLSLTVLCAIGHHIVFRLGWWSTLLPARFHVPCGTLVSISRLTLSLTGVLPSLPELSISLQLKSYVRLLTHNPGEHAPRFGLFPVRSPLLRKSLFIFSSCRYLDVSVPGVPSCKTMDLSYGAILFGWRVPPFGYPRIEACLRLPVAFRSVPRPSSAYGARASTLCSL